ncbi:hypothetical protein TcCL_Unassigned02730 [Trypanosoma cruzi]|nr:hypothetical protein TcCL_Unassigned02730 [Trypanosoma cruzi]
MQSALIGTTQEHKNCATRRGRCNQANEMLHGGKQTPPRPSINQSRAACLFMGSPFWFQARRKAFVAQHQPRVASCRQGNQVRTTEYIIREIALICGKRHRTRRKQVRMMSLHVGCAACQLKENSVKRKSSHSPPPQTVLSGRPKHQAGGSTLVEGYRDALTRPRACPHNVLLLFPRRTRPHRLLSHIQEGSDGEWHLVSQQRSIP